MKKRERGIIVSVLIACVIALLILTSQAAWKYNSGDLWGADNVQDSLDTEEARAKAAEVVNTTSITTEVARATIAEGLLASKSDVWGAPTATPSTNLLVNTVAIQAKTAAGGDLSEFRLIRVWTSETSMGSASTNNIETLVLSTGTAVDTVTAHADYRYVTATTGSAVATITATAAGTNYVMLSDGSSISATAITFE